MIELLTTAAGLLEQGEDLVLARVISVKGSAPRESGAGMIIRRNGEIEGTVGGGLIEATAMKKASEVFRSGGYALLDFDMTGDKLTPAEMVCGGKAELLLEYLPASEEINSIFTDIQACRRNRHSGYLVTAIPESREGAALLAHYLVSPERVCATGSDGSVDVVQRMKDMAYELSESGQIEVAGKRFWVDIIRNRGITYIFGAGHISREVNDLALRVGFMTVVLDDREEFANRKRFHQPAEVIVLESFENCFQGLNIDDDSFIVIVTRGHIYDKVVLAQALRSQAGYIGMIGSVRKKETIYRALLAEGFTQDDLDRVHCPIGIKIETETPAEIAVSILGELIDVRAKRRNAAK